MLHCDRWVNSVNKIALGIQKITKRLWRLSEDVAVVFISLCISQGLHSRLHNVSCKWSKSRCDYRESWLAPEERYSRRSFLKFDSKAKKDTSLVEMASFQFLLPEWSGCLVSFGSQPRSHYFSVSNIALWCT